MCPFFLFLPLPFKKSVHATGGVCVSGLSGVCVKVGCLGCVFSVSADRGVQAEGAPEGHEDVPAIPADEAMLLEEAV